MICGEPRRFVIIISSGSISTPPDSRSGSPPRSCGRNWLRPVGRLIRPFSRRPWTRRCWSVTAWADLIARLQTLESRDDFWQLVSEQPISQLEAPDEVDVGTAPRALLRAQSLGSPRDHHRFTPPRQQLLQRGDPMARPTADSVARIGVADDRTAGPDGTSSVCSRVGCTTRRASMPCLRTRPFCRPCGGRPWRLGFATTTWSA